VLNRVRIVLILSFAGAISDAVLTAGIVKSAKLQAASFKLQASSFKRQA